MTLLDTLLGNSSDTELPSRPSPVFKLPIEYLPESVVQSIPHNIITDLELCQSASTEVPPMYACIEGAPHSEPNADAEPDAEPDPIHAKMSRLFTTDTAFLKEYQQIISALSTASATPQPCQTMNKMARDPLTGPQWDDFQTHQHFEETYYYMEFDFLKSANRSETALQMLYMLNMISPVLTLLSPLMVFITPFFMLKFLNAFKFTDVKITLSLYWSIVKRLIADLAIVKVFRLSREHTMQEILMTIVYAVLFIYTNYQNAVACTNFHRKIGGVYDFIGQLRTLGKTTRHRIQQYQHTVKHINHVTHKPFMDTMDIMSSRLDCLIEHLTPIKECWSGFNIDTVRQIGYTMKVYYELKKDAEWDELVTYLIELNQYLDFMEGVAGLYKKGAINMCDFVCDASGNRIKFVDNYYAANVQDHSHASHNGGQMASDMKTPIQAQDKWKIGPVSTPRQQLPPVKNTIKMGANMIISGPNASGKTTLMKSVLLNIIFTQQLGVGFYGVGSALRPFKYVHCYLNIPDTSGRDSLFQAEARRCKEILDSLQADTDPQTSHFVMFDELFSGTNPEEAVKSSTAFIKYLAAKNPNSVFMLTTHYKKVCKFFKTGGSTAPIANWRMKVNVNAANKIQYTYKIERGISKIKGGVHVLKDMGYPKELLASVSQ